MAFEVINKQGEPFTYTLVDTVTKKEYISDYDSIKVNALCDLLNKCTCELDIVVKIVAATISAQGSAEITVEMAVKFTKEAKVCAKAILKEYGIV